MMLPYIIIPLVTILLIAVILLLLAKGITCTVTTETMKNEPYTDILLDMEKNTMTRSFSFDQILNIQRKKKKDYSSLFLVESDKIARNGKTVNIRPEFHARLSLLLRVSTNSDITLFSYIDNILKVHLDTYQAEIDELLEDSIKQLLPLNKKR